MTRQDKLEFELFCHYATNPQIINIYQKEKDAGRNDYAAIAKLEMARRGLT